jgi:hypothetical protein
MVLMNSRNTKKLGLAPSNSPVRGKATLAAPALIVAHALHFLVGRECAIPFEARCILSTPITAAWCYALP